MSRVSQLEFYNDKDVITQILLMKERVETGTYKEVRVAETGGNYVFEFVNQKDEVETFTVPAKQISGVTSSQAGSTVTMRITYNDGTYQDVSWTAGGNMTTDTVQTVSAQKIFLVSPVGPDTPSGPQAYVNMNYVESTVPGTNNIVHKSGAETIAGAKTLTQALTRSSSIPGTPDNYIEGKALSMIDADQNEFIYLGGGKSTTSTVGFLGAKGSGSYYAKLAIRVNRDTGKVDLILESSTQQGYEQHIIYSFGS